MSFKFTNNSAFVNIGYIGICLSSTWQLQNSEWITGFSTGGGIQHASVLSSRSRLGVEVYPIHPPPPRCGAPCCVTQLQLRCTIQRTRPPHTNRHARRIHASI